MSAPVPAGKLIPISNPSVSTSSPSITWGIGIFIFLLVLVGLILLFYFLYRRTNPSPGPGVPTGSAFVVQQGTSGSTDTVNTGGNNLYIARNSGRSLLLTIAPNSNNATGNYFYISNPGANPITYQAGSGLTIQNDAFSSTIQSQKTAIFVFTDLNKAQRIQ